MKVLITGGTASQIRESTSRQPITLSGLMAQALRERGHDVTVRAFSVQDIETDVTGQDNDYDFVFVGQSPLRGLGSAYMYCALAAQHRFSERYAIFSDDVATRKIGAEWQIALKRPDDFVKPFWQYKRDWLHARRPNVLSLLLDQVAVLVGNDDEKYPEVFIPAWTYDLAFSSAVHLSPHARMTTHGVDPSVWMDCDLTRKEPDENRYWATCWSEKSRDLTQMGARLWSVQKIDTTTWKELESASGLLVPTAAWAPELRLALMIGVPVATDWKTMGSQFGEPFECLTANVEIVDDARRDELAATQLESLQSKSSSREDFPDMLELMMQKTLGQ